ncbi:MAG: tetratricopeptide (TPR) repeat protein [Pseudohongiellaceae bacterium]|jgi:tetratricopeptide (TPR) repeat protein
MFKEKAKKFNAVILLSSSILLVACGGGEERQEQYLTKAQDFYEQENYEKAKIEVKNVLQINPKNADGRYLLGMLAEQNQDFRGAFGNFNSALEEDPLHIKSLNKIAGYYVMSKDIEKGEVKVNEALAIDANNADALAILASIYAQQEKSAESIEKAQQALAIEPGHVQATSVLTVLYAQDNPELAMDIITQGISNQSKNESLKVLKIRLLASQDKRDEVVTLYKELITEHPDKLLYPYQLVNIYLRDDRNEEEVRKQLAETTLRDLVVDKPEEEQIKLWLVEFLSRNRSIESAVKELEGFASAEDSSFKIKDELAKVYINTDKADQAKAVYNGVIDSDPKGSESIEARNKLVVLALRDNNREQADVLLAEIFDIEPENSQALIIRARLKLSEKNIDDAVADLRVVLKNEPESVQALGLLATAYEQNNSADLALDNYQRLIAVEPKNIGALVGASRILIAKNELENALALLESAKTINDANPEVVRLLTDLYSREQRWDEALSAAAKLTEDDKTMALGYYLQGRTHLRAKDLKAAVVVLEKSLEIQPSGVETLSALVGAYVALEEKDKALNYLKAHVKANPEHIHAKELLANIYARMEDLVTAESMLLAIIEEQPGRSSAYQALARIYAFQRKQDDIEKLYQTGVAKVPDNATLRATLAEIYQARRKFSEAVKEYETILAANPDAIVIKNNLAALLMDHFNTPENLQRVLVLSEDLAATEAPAFLDTAGWAQYLQGNYAQALSLLAAAADNGGKGPLYHYHLGMAYFKSDMKVQAKEQLELATADENAQFPGREEADATLMLL